MSEQSNEPYAKYKESRRNWLGEIPAHWSAFALKFLSSERVQDGPHETPTFVDNGIPFFSVDGIQDNELVLEGGRFISESDHERYSQKCRPATGDVLLGKAASVGKVAHVQLTEPFNVWSPLAVIRPQDERMGRYIYYALQSAYLQAQCLVQSNSNTQKNLSMRAIDNLCFPAPPVAEQTQIAKFLDYEPPKIDALIEKQQQLIASLKEKRQAVISHAVTKGLNPDAPMRDSGVEWLGEVPAHWEVVKLKHLVALPIIDGPHETPTKCDEGVPFISAEAVSSGDIDFEKMWGFISHEDHARYRKRYVSTNGDILMVKLGATTGTVAMVDTTIEFNVWVPLAVIAYSSSAKTRARGNCYRTRRDPTSPRIALGESGEWNRITPRAPHRSHLRRRHRQDRRARLDGP